MPEPRLGLTFPLGTAPLADQEPIVRRLESLGYDGLWTPESTGPDGFTPLALAAAWTERMRLGVGVASVFTRGRTVLAQTAATLAEASGGRFVLGLGASSDRIVEEWNGLPFERPLSKVREVVGDLRVLLAGGRGPGGFRLGDPPSSPVPIYVAALRTKMLRAAGELGDGVWINFVPVSGLRQVVAEIEAGARRAGREAGGVEVICRTMNVTMPVDEGIESMRSTFAGYASVPVYTEFFRWLGWGERLAPMLEAWAAGDRRLAAELVPEDLIREVAIFGGPEEQLEQLRAMGEAGVDAVSLTPIGDPRDALALIEGVAAGN
jgi:probable F420-dependent oxidoreductase